LLHQAAAGSDHGLEAPLWMSFLFMSLVLLEVTDGVLALIGGSSLAETGAGGSELGSARRRTLTVAGFAPGAGTVGVVYAMRPPVIRRVEYRLDCWPRAGR